MIAAIEQFVCGKSATARILLMAEVRHHLLLLLLQARLTVQLAIILLLSLTVTLFRFDERHQCFVCYQPVGEIEKLFDGF
jgi:hypothetical protein